MSLRRPPRRKGPLFPLYFENGQGGEEMAPTYKTRLGILSETSLCGLFEHLEPPDVLRSADGRYSETEIRRLGSGESDSEGTTTVTGLV